MIVYVIILTFVAGGALTPLIIEYVRAKEEQAQLEKRLKNIGLNKSSPTSTVQLPCCGLYSAKEKFQHLRQPINEIEQLKLLDAESLPAHIRSMLKLRDDKLIDKVTLDKATDYVCVILRVIENRGLVATLFPAFIPNWSCQGLNLDDIIIYKPSGKDKMSLPYTMPILPTPIATYDNVVLTDIGEIVITELINSNHLPLLSSGLTECGRQHLEDHICPACTLEHMYQHDCNKDQTDRTQQLMLDQEILRRQVKSLTSKNTELANKLDESLAMFDSLNSTLKCSRFHDNDSFDTAWYHDEYDKCLNDTITTVSFEEWPNALKLFTRLTQRLHLDPCNLYEYLFKLYLGQDPILTSRISKGLAERTTFTIQDDDIESEPTISNTIPRSEDWFGFVNHKQITRDNQIHNVYFIEPSDIDNLFEPSISGAFDYIKISLSEGVIYLCNRDT